MWWRKMSSRSLNTQKMPEWIRKVSSRFTVLQSMWKTIPIFRLYQGFTKVFVHEATTGTTKQRLSWTLNRRRSRPHFYFDIHLWFSVWNPSFYSNCFDSTAWLLQFGRKRRSQFGSTHETPILATTGNWNWSWTSKAVAHQHDFTFD